MKFVNIENSKVNKRTSLVLPTKKICSYCNGTGMIIIAAEQVATLNDGVQVREEYRVPCTCQRIANK